MDGTALKGLVGVLGIVLVGSMLLEMFPQMGDFRRSFDVSTPVPTLVIPTVVPIATPTNSTVITNLNVASYPTQDPPPYEDPTPERPVLVFDEAVPQADSPEITSEQRGACFSMYSRQRNEAGACLGEWYWPDTIPRAGDQYWCAVNGANVEWVPIRLYDGRGTVLAEPFGKPDRCN